MAFKPPHLNASLMHELRMLSMILIPAALPVIRALNNREPKKKEKTHIVGMTCVFCIHVVKRDLPEPAITVLNGNAVCQRHITYAQKGDFSNVLSTILREPLI